MATNRWAVETYSEDSAGLAIIRQRTVYPHHFVTDVSVLNELGAHELGILAPHLREHGGKLNVARGGADNDLYQRRLDSVQNYLLDAGLEEEQIALADELPGGEGLPGRHVIVILGGPVTIPNYPNRGDALQRPEVQQ
ncbi:MAG: hypothetical protein WD294_16945 [Phycisphaeraceae bacterium]